MTEEKLPPEHDEELEQDDVRNDAVPTHPDDPAPGEDDPNESAEDPG
jgi:hypothetical protein